MTRVIFTVPDDFSLRTTLRSHGWRHLKPFVPDDDRNTLTRVHKFDDAKVCQIVIQDSTNGSLSITSDADVNPEALIAVARHMLQLDVELGKFHDYCSAIPKLSHMKQQRLGRMLRSPTLFEDVVKVIATVNTTWAQTCGMVNRLCDSFGESWPGDPHKRTFPSAEQIATVPFDEFATKARMGYRNAYVHAIATLVFAEELNLENFPSQYPPGTDLRKAFLSLPGIGPYGAACLMLYVGRPEHVNVDSWARTLVSKEIGKKVSDKEVTLFFETFGAWKGLVYVFYPWK